LEEVELITVLNVIRPEIDYHFVIFFVKGKTTNPDALQNLEPEKCYEWKWVTWEEFMELHPKFFPLQQYLDEVKINPFE
jgi:8-oxo-dGTP diphosphatase